MEHVISIGLAESDKLSQGKPGKDIQNVVGTATHIVFRTLVGAIAANETVTKSVGFEHWLLVVFWMLKLLSACPEEDNSKKENIKTDVINRTIILFFFKGFLAFFYCSIKISTSQH